MSPTFFLWWPKHDRTSDANASDESIISWRRLGTEQWAGNLAHRFNNNLSKAGDGFIWMLSAACPPHCWALELWQCGVTAASVVHARLSTVLSPAAICCCATFYHIPSSSTTVLSNPHRLMNRGDTTDHVAAPGVKIIVLLSLMPKLRLFAQQNLRSQKHE